MDNKDIINDKTNKNILKTKCKCCDKNFIRGEAKFKIKGYGTVHKECYRNKLLETYTEEYANNKINELMKIENEKKQKLKENATKRKLKDEKKKEEDDRNRIRFIEYIQDIYDTSLQKATFIKLSKIVNGTYKGLKEGISYDDLYYMFNSKQNYLNKVYMNNISKGMTFKTGIDRFNYDLAIIVNKYDSYKQWKERQKIIQSDIELEKKQNEDNIKIDFKKINNKKENNSNEVDIADILDDLY